MYFFLINLAVLKPLLFLELLHQWLDDKHTDHSAWHKCVDIVEIGLLTIFAENI